MNLKLKFNNHIDGYVPFNNIKKQIENSISEVNLSLDLVMNHYSLFLQDEDYDYGRIRQFEEPDIDEAIIYQKEICRLTWLRTKCFKYESKVSVDSWKHHRAEFNLLLQMKEAKKNE